MQDKKNSPASGHFLTVARTPISWRAVFAGLFVATIVYAALICLGLALGGRGLYSVLEGEDSMRDLGFGAAIWTIASVMVALYLGGHVSGRVAGLISTRVGRIQGLVITSIFFVAMFAQVGLLVGSLGGGLSNALSIISTTNVQSAIGQEIIEDSIGDLNFRSPFPDVVAGIASRMLRGDNQSASTFLAYQAGISLIEAEERIDILENSFARIMQQVGTDAARTIRNAGWTLFSAIVLGSIAGMIGGGLAANYNLREPISSWDNRALQEVMAL